jgi:hypothetical protein
MWGDAGGPIPPWQGGGSGYDSNGTPTFCEGGGWGNYQDNSSFCTYIAARWRYLENECGNFGTAILNIDPALGTIAQNEAIAVANGACPKGDQICGNRDEALYESGTGGGGKYFTSDAMFTAPETTLLVYATDSQEACQFTGENANGALYHYCGWDGNQNYYGQPSTQPSRVGCGTAVDKGGVTWRVVKLGK